MHNLTAIMPMGGSSPRQDQVGNITITEVIDTALASVTCRLGKDKAFRTAAKRLFGGVMPEPGHWAPGSDYALIWTGPDQWFAEAPFATHEDIARIVKAALGDTASVTEQTDGWARFDVEGATVVDMFERLSAVSTRRMQGDQATRTSIEHLGCYLICREPGRRISIIGPRSSAGSIHHALITAAQSVA